MTSRLKHAGLILAAGASERMGSPKALLPAPGNIPLAQYQAGLLKHGGCAEVVVVLGADYEKIKDALRACDLVHNAFWERGRFSSAQVGLRALRVFDGIFILPVDTVGVSLETVRVTFTFADEKKPLAVRPTFHGENGKVAWVSRALAEEVTRMDTASRLNEVLESRALKLPVNDPAILSNVNTLEDWEEARSRLSAISAP